MNIVSFEHYDTLPYLHAITKETLRWRDVLPMGNSNFDWLFEEY
jgi:hypothetical protein